MHQPDYRDDSGFLKMPWVFLHSIKDYYDMPWLLSLYPSLKATFNLTPTLMEQIKIYEKYGYKKDNFLISWIKETKELNEKERISLIKICKSTQFDTMVVPFERYKELYHKEEYSDDELNDLEVLFMLSWCGNYLRKNNSIVQELILKQRGYSLEDKERLLKSLINFIPKILPFYRMILEKKQISISTTPLNHPILPLLLNMKNAKISNPKTVLPKKYMSLRDDAYKQVDLAIEMYKKIFKKEPTGFWPAEGAVDEESLRLYRQKGIKWVATDEAILFKSINKEDEELKYKRYAFDGVFIGFRDHAISDKIGFHYRYKKHDEAVSDFMSEIKSKKDDANIVVIVDGENAWEFYKNNGYDFFIKLYEELSKDEHIKTKTFDEISSLKSENLKKLHPGSWIYGNFNTWAGHSEKNRAWELIYQTKRDINGCKVDEKKRALIDKHFLASECSDWFWWYGEDHFSDFLEDFDTLFRSHLSAIYRICDLKVPTAVLLPIRESREIKFSSIKPKFNITVEVDGKESSFFEWLGSGMIDESRVFSTMDGARGVMKKLYYGEDENYFYIRFDGDVRRFLKEYKKIKLHFKKLKYMAEIPVQKSFKSNTLQMMINKIVEIRLDKKIYKNKKKIDLKIEFEDKFGNSEYLPIFGDIELCSDDYEKNWFV